MSELADQEGLSILLTLDPDRVGYASSNRIVGEWNLLVIDELVKDAIYRFPDKLSKMELKQYSMLKERLNKISHQFMIEHYDHTLIARRIEILSQKLEPFKKETPPLLEKTLNHVVAKRIRTPDLCDMNQEQARKFIRDLVLFFDHDVIPAMYHVKTPEQREILQTFLKKTVRIKEALDLFDYDGMLEESVNTLLKHFLFISVISDRIYHNLLHYQEGSLDLSDLKLCQQAAHCINEYILKRLLPFLQDPEILPCYEEIVKIYWNLSTFNEELISRYLEEGALFTPSLQALEKLI